MSVDRMAPTDDGIALATISRGGDKQLRIRWREFKGHHFLDLREWQRRDDQSSYWPVKGRGISVKVHELAELAKALEAAREFTHDR